MFCIVYKILDDVRLILTFECIQIVCKICFLVALYTLSGANFKLSGGYKCL